MFPTAAAAATKTAAAGTTKTAAAATKTAAAAAAAVWRDRSSLGVMSSTAQ